MIKNIKNQLRVTKLIARSNHLKMGELFNRGKKADTPSLLSGFNNSY